MRVFTFSEALTAIKMGFKMRRECWKDNYYVSLENGKIMVTDLCRNTCVEWDAENRHLLAEDWCKYIPPVLNSMGITVGSMNAADAMTKEIVFNNNAEG